MRQGSPPQRLAPVAACIWRPGCPAHKRSTQVAQKQAPHTALFACVCLHASCSCWVDFTRVSLYRWLRVEHQPGNRHVHSAGQSANGTLRMAALRRRQLGTASPDGACRGACAAVSNESMRAKSLTRPLADNSPRPESPATCTRSHPGENGLSRAKAACTLYTASLETSRGSVRHWFGCLAARADALPLDGGQRRCTALIPECGPACQPAEVST